MKNKFFLLPVLLVLFVIMSGCSVDLAKDTADVDMQAYEGSSGYSLNIPVDWVKGEETADKVEFHDSTDQIALSINSELGGVAYYSMKEIKEQLIEDMGESLFGDYDITDNNGGTKYFDVMMKGADKDGAKIVVDLYASEPFVSMRHYLVFIASYTAYEENASLIEDIKSSFTITLSEEQYLQLMEARRDAAQAEISGEDTASQTLDETQEQSE